MVILTVPHQDPDAVFFSRDGEALLKIMLCHKEQYLIMKLLKYLSKNSPEGTDGNQLEVKKTAGKHSHILNNKRL